MPARSIRRVRRIGLQCRWTLRALAKIAGRNPSAMVRRELASAAIRLADKHDVTPLLHALMEHKEDANDPVIPHLFGSPTRRSWRTTSEATAASTATSTDGTPWLAEPRRRTTCSSRDHDRPEVMRRLVATGKAGRPRPVRQVRRRPEGPGSPREGPRRAGRRPQRADRRPPRRGGPHCRPSSPRTTTRGSRRWRTSWPSASATRRPSSGRSTPCADAGRPGRRPGRGRPPARRRSSRRGRAAVRSTLAEGRPGPAGPGRGRPRRWPRSTAPNLAAAGARRAGPTTRRRSGPNWSTPSPPARSGRRRCSGDGRARPSTGPT